MIANFKKLWQYRELLISLTLREVKARYKQSIIGIGWAVLQPFLLMVVFTIVFTKFARISTNGIPYPIFAYSALLPWTFFAASLSFAIPSIVANINLVTKTYFPREIFPIAAVGACAIDFLVASIIFVIMLIVYQVSITLKVLLIPLVLLIQILLTLGLSFVGAAVNVYYRDVRHIIPIGLQIWMFLSPVIYSTDMVPQNLKIYFYLNPLSGIIEAYRNILLLDRFPEATSFGISFLISIVIFTVSYRFFKQQEMKFADVI